jgi:type IV pilus assembly protein PilE
MSAYRQSRHPVPGAITEDIVIRRNMRIRNSGFTLVELMVVVTIAAILFGVAVPAYQSQVRHSRRTDAKTALLDLAGREEKFLTLQNSYTATAANVGYAALPVTIGGGYYQVYVCVGTAPLGSCTSVTGTTGSSFVVSAIAVAGTSQAKDSSCQYFAVDNTGTQYSWDSTAGTGNNTTATCWQ